MKLTVKRDLATITHHQGLLLGHYKVGISDRQCKISTKIKPHVQRMIEMKTLTISDPDTSDAWDVDFDSARSRKGRESADEGSESDNTFNLGIDIVVLPRGRGHSQIRGRRRWACMVG